MINEAFEKALKEYESKHLTGPSGLVRKIASHFYDVRQPEIDAKEKVIDDLALQKGILKDKIGRLESELTEAKAIVNELRVLIQNSLTVDRNTPIWEMVKEFDRKYGEAE